MTRKILSPNKKDVKSVIFNFRLTYDEAKALREKLKLDNRKAQHFFESIVRAYLNGRIS